VTELQAAGELPLILWDESVLEKSESLKAERLCAVHSSKAQRLKRIKPGYFNPPGGRPIFVPGFNWLQILVIGRKGSPTLAHLRWWTTREAPNGRKKGGFCRKSMPCGARGLVYLGSGLYGHPLAFVHAARFVMRWPKHYKLCDQNGQLRKPGEISKGKRSWEHRLLWEARRRCQRQVGIIALPVSDPVHHQPLWLVVARRKHQSPWYLLTTQPVRTPEEAWNVVHAYARRWQVEMTVRFNKSELAFESPRLVKCQHRKKLLLMAALAYAFLLSLLDPRLDPLRRWLLRTFCHRTGKRSRDTPAPLYRLRLAISLFWFSHPPPFFFLL